MTAGTETVVSETVVSTGLKQLSVMTAGRNCCEYWPKQLSAMTAG